MFSLKDSDAAFFTVLFLLVGSVIGWAKTVDDVNNSCRDYGKYVTAKYTLTCEVKK